jgi:hypothetical protein
MLNRNRLIYSDLYYLNSKTKQTREKLFFKEGKLHMTAAFATVHATNPQGLYQRTDKFKIMSLMIQREYP